MPEPDRPARSRPDPLFAGCCALYVLVGIAHVFWGAISPFALARSGGTAADLSVLLLTQFTGFLGGVLTAPVLTRSLGFRTHVSLALGLVLLALGAVLLATTTDALAVSGAALGFAAGTVEAAAGASVLGPGRHARHLAVLEMCFGLGALGFPIAMFGVSRFASWDCLVVVVGAAVAIMLVGWLTGGVRERRTSDPPGARPDAGTPPPGTGRRGHRQIASNVLIAFAFAYAGIETNAANFLPRMLGAGADPGNSSAILTVSVFWTGIVAGRLLASLLGERAVTPKALIAMVTVMALSTVGLGTTILDGTAAALGWIAAMGLGAGGIFPCALTMATRLASRSARTTTSLFVAAASMGGALVALPAGLVIDRWSGVGGAVLFSVLGGGLVLIVIVQQMIVRRTAHA